MCVCVCVCVCVNTPYKYPHMISLSGLSEVSILPARYAYLLKTDISDEEAVLLEREEN